MKQLSAKRDELRGERQRAEAGIEVRGERNANARGERVAWR